MAITKGTIVATPKTAGIWMVRECGKHPRQVDEADIFSMPDFEEKIAACEKKHKKQHYTFTIDPPPTGWSVAVGEIVKVNIEGVGFVPAPITKTFVDGWFEVKLKTQQYKTPWRDQLSYLEEGSEWVRTTSSLVKEEKADEKKEVLMPETSFAALESLIRPVLVLRGVTTPTP